MASRSVKRLVFPEFPPLPSALDILGDFQIDKPYTPSLSLFDPRFPWSPSKISFQVYGLALTSPVSSNDIHSFNRTSSYINPSNTPLQNSSESFETKEPKPPTLANMTSTCPTLASIPAPAATPLYTKPPTSSNPDVDGPHTSITFPAP